MTSYSALQPVSAAIYTALNVPALLALAPGGVGDDMGQRVTAADGTFATFVLYEVHDKAIGGLGTKPGVKQLSEIDLRLHVFSQFQGFSDAQAVVDQALQLLADPPAVSGYNSWAIFHDETLPFSDQIVAAVKVKELVVLSRLYVEYP